MRRRHQFGRGLAGRLLLALALVAGVAWTRAAGGPRAADDEEELQLVEPAGGAGPREPLDPFAFTFDDYLREASRSSGHQDEPHQAPRPAGLVGGAAGEGGAPEPTAPAPLAAGHGKGFGLQQQQQQQQGRPDDDDNGPAAPAPGELLDEIKLLFAWKALPTNKCSKACGKGFRLNHLSCVDLKFNVRVEDELCARAQLSRPSELADEPCNQLDCAPQWTPVEYGAAQCNASADSPDCRHATFKRLECTMLDSSGQTVRLDESRCSGSPADARPQPAGAGTGTGTTTGTTTGTSNGTSNDTTTTTSTTTTTTTTTTTSSSSLAPDEFSVDLPVGDHDQERNDILAAYDAGPPAHDHQLPAAIDNGFYPLVSSHNDKSRHHHHHHHQPFAPSSLEPFPNEPFYRAAEWSQCSGAPCGQLGRRYRNLTCHLYLSKSAKLVDLPLASCQSAAPVHYDEPCYMDCAQLVADVHYYSTSGNEPSPAPQGARAGHQGGDADDTGGASVVVANDDDDNDNDNDESIYDLTMARFIWRHERWTECSAQCLGGTTESLVECYDKVTATRAKDERLCEERGPRPRPLVERCNEGPCAPEWRPGPFSNCSRRCGSAGTRTRSVACVQLVALDTGELDYMLMPDELCASHWAHRPAPHKTEPCNRFDCAPEWQPGPWGECSRKCGEGERARPLVCVQEFAGPDGPGGGGGAPAARHAHDLAEALRLARREPWHPGKATQVPLDECYRAHRSVPAVSERCFGQCHEPEAESESGHQQALFIDAEPMQSYRMAQDGARRRTVTLKVGGRAQVIEGRNVKIRCRIIGASKLVNNTTSLVKHDHQRHQVEWRKDGVRIFANGSTMADKQPSLDTDNSILANDLLNDDRLPLSDQPDTKRDQKLSPLASSSASGGATPAAPQKSGTQHKPKGRNLSVRSWNSLGVVNQQLQGFQFVAQPGGRFALVKDNTLRIKRLKLDDSGVYTCTSGPLSESIELSVVSKRHHLLDNDAGESVANSNYYA